MTLKNLASISDVRSQVAEWRQRQFTIGFVPTMGALHDGHMGLVKTAKAMCDKVIASVFVNPLQFAPDEDFEAYPRNPDHDTAMLSIAGADALFMPERSDIYAFDFSTYVNVSDVSEPLEGEFRPPFFNGVATVVTKLFNIVTPTHAFFGEKDYQQLCVIRRMVRDLNIPVEIIGMPIVREEDGLALSSRNAYLTPDQRAIAPKLYQALLNIVSELEGTRNTDDILSAACQAIKKAGFDKVDYLAFCDADTLLPKDKIDHNPARLLVAAYLGKTRLIDNIPL